MSICYWFIALLVMFTCPALAANKDIVQLQREVALLEDRVRMLQRSMDERMGSILALVRQTLDRVNLAHTENAVMHNTVTERLRRMEQSVSLPVATLSTKLDQAASDSLALRESLAETDARLKRMEQKLVDVENAVRIMQAPPLPPSASGAMGGPPAGVTAQGLFQAATKDQLAGNYDLALQEFQEYLRYFRNTELAASSQFHIGEIAYMKGDWKSAQRSLGIVIQQYPKSGVAPDALYLKAKALLKQGRRSEAIQQLNKLVRSYRNSDAAIRAQSDLKSLRGTPGISRTAPRK